jgi:hypothetical protein
MWKQPTVSTRELRNANNILVGITERKKPIGRLWHVKLIKKKLNVRMWNELNWAGI